MTNEHTPGPWQYERRKYTDNTSEIEVSHLLRPGGNECRIVASVATSTPADQKPNEEELANARLIAAAPDLLAECQQLICDIDCVGHPGKSSVDRIRSAIAKTTGPEKEPDNGSS